MAQLGALTDQMTPVVTDVGAVAPDVNRMIEELGPLSKAGIPALESLGEAADRGTPAVKAALPVATDLKQLSAVAKPVGANLRKLLVSLQNTGGIERAMDYVFFQVGGVNGFDSFGHYLRAALTVNQCSNYATTPVFGCSANFSSATATSAVKAARASGDETLVNTARALTGKKAKKVAPTPIDEVVTAPADPKPAATPTPTPGPDQTKTDTLLDYLFGGDG
jgi:hypothetical protein